MSKAGRTSILMANEGTYPYVGGGVSTWCHILCENLDEFDWHIFAVVADPYVTDNYMTDKFPQIVNKIIVPLWGYEETAEYADHRNFMLVLKSKLKTSDKVIKELFLPLFKDFLNGIESDSNDMKSTGEAILGMYEYFQKYDYNLTMKSQWVWSFFRDFSLKVTEGDEVLSLDPPCLFDVTTCMRWMYNMFVPIVVKIPKTDLTHATIASSTALACIISKLKYNTPMILTDHGVYARERYIACSVAEFSSFPKRFLARLALVYSRLCYYYSDIIAPCAHFNARWELPLGGHLPRVTPRSYEGWDNTGVVPNLKEFPPLEPTYKALEDLGCIDSYNKDTEFPWIRTIYNGVDTDRFKPGEKPDKLKGKLTAVALARVFALKDILTMIRACAVVKKEIPEVSFIVYGSLKADPPYVQECNDLIAELDLKENFNLAGYHSKPNEAFWEGDISVLSSISEGFPFTVLESMAAGVPVVGTDVGGVKEAIGMGDDACGIVVPPRDPQAFGEAVIKMLQSEELRSEFAIKGRERILRLFQTETSVGAYRNIYNQLSKYDGLRSKNTL